MTQVARRLLYQGLPNNSMQRTALRRFKTTPSSGTDFQDGCAACSSFDSHTASFTGSSPNTFTCWLWRTSGADLGTGAVTDVSNNGMQRSSLRAAADAYR